MANYDEIEFSTEIVKNRLYFAVTYQENIILKNTANIIYFNIDHEFLYANYYYDFGPLNISCLFRYCCKLNTFMQNISNVVKIVHYTSRNQKHRANASYLMGCYAVIYLKMEPRAIYRLLLNAGGPFRNYVDASPGPSQFTIRIIDCLQAIEKAMSFNFFDFNDFDVTDYDIHTKLQFGDLNWLVPRKFLAFIGPSENECTHTRAPEYYVKYFLKNDVKTVIRLNNKTYDASTFKKAGIEHYDLFFPDGSTPPRTILLRFLDIAENNVGAIGVHCKAGLGRTGSLIGAYIIKHYRMTARETIAWLRICRPGSVIGQQQEWLEKIESWLWRQGSHYRLEHFGEGDKIPKHKFGIYSKMWPIQRKKLLFQAEMHKRDKMKIKPPSPSSALPLYQSTTKTDNLRYATNKFRKEFQKNKRFSENQYELECARQKSDNANDQQGDVRKESNEAQQQVFEQFEPSQGDKLNEIKLNRYMTGVQEEINVAPRRKFRPDEIRALTRRRNELLDDTPEISLNKIRMKHMANIKDILINPEARKRALNNVFKTSHTYKNYRN